MQSMSDDELDKLFKEAAEGFNAPQDSSAWQDMLRRLDKRPMPSGFWNWKTISTAAFIGLTGIGIVWYASESDSNSLPAEALSKRENVQEVEPKNNQTIAENEVPEVKEDLAAEIPSEDIAQSRSNVSNSSNPGANSMIKQDAASNEKITSNNDDPLHEPPTPKGQNPTKEESGSHINEVSVPVSSAVIPLVNTETDLGVAVSEHKSDSNKPGNSSVLSDSVKEAEALKKLSDSTEVVEDTEDQQDKKLERGSGISIKLAVAPDFSSVNYYTPDKSGFNYGVLVGYSFNNRWSVYSGAIYSKKIYSSDEIDEPYTTSGGYDYDVTELYGDCRVIDIPINVYYTFFPERSFSIKAGIGFTSYIMLQEDYTYYVDNPYGPDEYSQSISNENNEWFKMLNVSVMLQKRLSNRFYLEFEPFLKAPLAGVGEGEVSLVSMGAFFNLRFDIPISRKP
jgi:hypothetical protein